MPPALTQLTLSGIDPNFLTLRRRTGTPLLLPSLARQLRRLSISFGHAKCDDGTHPSHFIEGPQGTSIWTEFFGATIDLTEVALQDTPWNTHGSSLGTCLLGSIKCKSLIKVKLDSVQCRSVDLTVMLLKSSQTLKDLDLYEVTLPDDDWSRTLQKLSGHLRLDKCRIAFIEDWELWHEMPDIFEQYMVEDDDHSVWNIGTYLLGRKACAHCHGHLVEGCPGIATYLQPATDA